RQRDRRQLREGGADRPQGAAEGLSPPHRLCRRHQGAQRQVHPRGPLSRADRREGGRAHAAARPAWPCATRQFAGLQGPGASARRAEPRTARRWSHEPQEQEERVTMAETMQSLEQLATLKPAAPEAPKYVQKLDKQGRAYATGKRKDAVARVWIKPGPGKI